MARIVVRVWVPDRPGALGLVASRIGAVRGEILGIEVLERGAGRAVDELVVELGDESLVDLLVEEVNAVDGVDVEDVRPAPAALHDPRLDALETAALLVAAATGDDVVAVLARHAKADLEAVWAAVIDPAVPALIVGDGEAPAPGWLSAFVSGSRTSDRVASGDWGPDQMAWAALPRAGLDLVLGRQGRPLRARERHQLMALARIADLRLTQLGPPASGRRPDDWAAPAGRPLG
ncbi:MAG TPA: hypothetical protein VNT56_08820 [Acidimicrobiales bacterium]|nr:hypothetical protein [Acidimicrobiales bacterium]